MEDIYDKDRLYLAQTYKKLPITLVEGKGAVVKDSKDKEYIDCFSGLAVLNVGHCHPKVVEAIKRQASQIMHSSNLYYIEPQIELAELLYKISGGYKAFMCNSGAEANEAALKLVRKYTGKSEVIAAKNSFHGRTLLTLSATGQEKYRRGFEPLVKGFIHVEFGSSEELEEVISRETAAVLLEPIQGEGGVVVPPKEYLREVRELCNENSALLVLDEIQTGLGRVGELFGWKLFEVEPDIFTLAKAMGGGFPIGAMLAKPEIMDAFEVGDHASTFGGNHLACAAAKAAVEVIVEEKLAERSKKLGNYLKAKLEKLKEKHSIRDVRGYGLMIGVELTEECSDIVSKAAEKGIPLNCTQERIIRFLPPLVIEKEQLDKAVEVFDDVLAEVGL